MFKFYFNKRPVVENSQSTNVSVFIRHCYLQIADKRKVTGQKMPDLNDESGVRQFIELIEKSVSLNLRHELNGETNITEENSVSLTYTRSNLEKGFVFWFICNLCGKRVRYLYFPPNSEVMACRICHRLAYKSQRK